MPSELQLALGKLDNLDTCCAASDLELQLGAIIRGLLKDKAKLELQLDLALAVLDTPVHRTQPEGPGLWIRVDPVAFKAWKEGRK